jgi:predicted nucleic-acid-binding protein
VKGVDTNLLVRYLTQDDLEQTRRVSDLFDRAEREGQSLFIATPVLCELVWVLQGRLFQVPKPGIATALEGLLATTIFEIQDRDLVQRAIIDYRKGPGDFADYLIGWLSHRAGCEETLTFDRALEDCERFNVLGSG